MEARCRAASVPLPAKRSFNLGKGRALPELYSPRKAPVPKNPAHGFGLSFQRFVLPEFCGLPFAVRNSSSSGVRIPLRSFQKKRFIREVALGPAAASRFGRGRARMLPRKFLKSGGRISMIRADAEARPYEVWKNFRALPKPRPRLNGRKLLRGQSSSHLPSGAISDNTSGPAAARTEMFCLRSSAAETPKNGPPAARRGYI